MKFTLVTLILMQTGCVTALIPHKSPEMMPNYSFSDSRYDMVRQEQARNQKQWAKWDRTHVPDDHTLVEIYDENGIKVGSAHAK